MASHHLWGPLAPCVWDSICVISGLESLCNSVKRDNERNKVIMFILWLLVNQCSVHVKQKSKAKWYGEKGMYYTVHILFILCISSRRWAFFWQLFVAGQYGLMLANLYIWLRPWVSRPGWMHHRMCSALSVCYTWWSRKRSYFWFTQWENLDKAKEKHMKSVWKHTKSAWKAPFSQWKTTCKEL